MTFAKTAGRLLLCVAVLLAGPVRGAESAADATDTAAPPAAPALPVPDAPDGDGAGEDDTGPSPEVFVPSEEISEDFTVSFPVDI